VDDEIRGLYKQVGLLIASCRRGKYTQTTLAQRLNLSRSSVANIERGEQTIQLHTLFKIARLLQVPPDDLLPDSPSVIETRGSLRDIRTINLIKAHRVPDPLRGKQ
jgi:transcriptional regulator with XRE-family HTH domain